MRKPDRWLERFFHAANIGFFDGRIPRSTTVKFAKMRDEGDTCYRGGVCDIRIHKDLAKHPDLAKIVLLHEMVHADLRTQGYLGYEHLHGHSTLFHAGLYKLWTQGAFENIL